MSAAATFAPEISSPRYRATALMLAAMCLFICSTRARAVESDPCEAGGSPARVEAVFDGLELALEDGRVLRLAGIDPARATPSRPGLGEDARARLAEWLVGRMIRVKTVSAAPDRWDRVLSLVYAPAQGPPGTEDGSSPARSVAEALLDAGWARARPDPETHACVARFMAAEARARAAALGLWADPYYAVTDADDPRGLMERTGGMVLVEGRIHLRNSSRRPVVTLGRAFRGVLLRLAPRLAKAPEKGGLDLRNLAEAQVRVRGFLDDRFGLRVEVVSGDQIEVLQRPVAGAPVGQGPPPND